MKKWLKIILNIVGCTIFFVLLSSIINYFTSDIELGYAISLAMIMIYLIILSVISYFRGLKVIKSGEFSSLSSAILPVIIVGICSSHNDYGWAKSLNQTRGAVRSIEKFDNSGSLIQFFVYTLYYFGLWNLLLFLGSFSIIDYYEVNNSINFNNVSNTLLTIAFISIMSGTIIVMLYGIIKSIKNKK